MLDLVLDFGLGEIREIERNFRRSSVDICKESIVTVEGESAGPSLELTT